MLINFTNITPSREEFIDWLISRSSRFSCLDCCVVYVEDFDTVKFLKQSYDGLCWPFIDSSQ